MTKTSLFLFLWRIANSFGNRTYLLFGSFSVAMFGFVWFVIPETKGISLEAMDELFGVTEGSKKDSVERQQDSADGKRPGAATEVEVR